MNEIEARPVPNCFPDRLFIDIVVRLKGFANRDRVLLTQVRDHVDIVRGPKATVYRARNGAAHVPSDSQSIQEVDERRQRCDEVIVPIHPTALW